MATIKVVGDAMVITSGISKKNIKDLGFYNPQALKLVDPESKDELFALLVKKDGESSGNQYGITFAGTDSTGTFPQATIKFPENTADKKEYIHKNYGRMIISLNKLENQMSAAVADLSTMIANVDAAISE